MSDDRPIGHVIHEQIEGYTLGMESDNAANMAAPIPPEYAAAHEFMTDMFGADGYTSDSVGQLVEVFLPCLRIMNDKEHHPWPEDGALWRKAGILPVMIFARAKWERYWERTWRRGIRHDDSGFDCINFLGFSMRADPSSRFGELGEPSDRGR